MLAGISVDYLVRLEQGREQRPSAAVLAALSDTLRLDEDERSHLRSLSAATTQTEMCPEPASPAPLAATTTALIERLDPTPAMVVEASGDLIAWNSAYDALMGATGLLDAQPPNLLRHLFLAPSARGLYRDWPTVARDQVAHHRAAAAHCTIAGALDAIVGELSVKSVDFARLWAEHDVVEHRRADERLEHPAVGALDFSVEVLLLPDADGRRLCTYLPANDVTTAALDELLGTTEDGARATRLRVVDGGAA